MLCLDQLLVISSIKDGKSLCSEDMTLDYWQLISVFVPTKALVKIVRRIFVRSPIIVLLEFLGNSLAVQFCLNLPNSVK